METLASNDPLMSWMKPRDVARLLDCSTSNVYDRIRRGKLTAVQTRFGWLVDAQSVEVYRACANRAQRRYTAPRCA